MTLQRIGTLKRLGRPPGIRETKPRRHVTGPAMVRVSVPMPPGMRERLRSEADARGVPFAAYVRTIIADLWVAGTLRVDR